MERFRWEFHNYSSFGGHITTKDTKVHEGNARLGIALRFFTISVATYSQYFKMYEWRPPLLNASPQPRK